MSRLITAINYKIRKNFTVKIAIVIDIFMVVAGILLFYAALKIISPEIVEYAGGYDTDLEAFDNINLFDCASITLSLMQIISIIYAIVITVIVSAEKKNGAFSLMISRGYTYKQVYISKVYETAVVSFLIYISYVIASLITGGILWHGEIEDGWISGFIRMFLLMLVMYISSSMIYLMVAMNVKNASAAIAINLCIVLILSGVVTGVDSAIWGDEIVIRKYWILSAIEQFAYIEKTDETLKEVVIGIIESIIYGGGSCLLGYKVFSSRRL